MPKATREYRKQEPVFGKQLFKKSDIDCQEQHRPKSQQESDSHHESSGKNSHQEITPGKGEQYLIGGRQTGGALLQVDQGFKAGQSQGGNKGAQH